MTKLQDRYWPARGLGGTLRSERHYNGREMRCYSDRPETIGAMFDSLVARYPDRPAIVEGESISYRELADRVARLAAGLSGAGVTAGDRVVLFLGNRWQFLATLLACCRLGALTVPIGTRQQAAELEFLINDCAATLLIFEAELATSLPDRSAVPTVIGLYATGGMVEGALSFDDLMNGNTAPAPAQLGEEDIAVILYTSGTTGQPKGATLTHLGIIHSSITFARCFGLSETDRALVAVPLSHVTGLVGVALTTMAAGGCVVLMRAAYKTPAFLALMSQERISYTIVVPTIYTLCAMNPEIDRYDLSAWRIGCFGGAPMPVATIEALIRKLPHLELTNAYGATETTSPTTIMPIETWRDHRDSVGQVVPCGNVKVMDENNREVSPGTAGELWIAGPMVVPGYWRRPDANNREFVDGYWRSGDIGSIDAQGFVRVYDRRKDMINRGGFKIFSAEVENVLNGLDGVVECAIIGRPDPVLGERVHAVVVITDQSTLTVANIQRYCAEQLADYKQPESVTITREALPKNANGKIQKALLRAALTT
ncbi:class I adenylate-forming enzyme family protein [Oceanibacterium hippocampi]|uniref:Long-chain-fatty-acid--CoA ligase n=1 Tax=Oceanibacterium hippocampi TaxID=745714 RepID=A0A1Y5TYA1_9PROT|nr:class I adenylate-forming enzyme family protein [Oceanibacterium hippocampi]SLN76515.1 Long-chain-fatty-acid--CoA ligase [Oceanibacterium hippocampi]